MLPDSADSEAAILGPDGVLEGARAGSIVIDMSSIAPLVSQRIAAECAKKGVGMLDAPVSGGEPAPSTPPWPSWWEENRNSSTRTMTC